MKLTIKQGKNLPDIILNVAYDQQLSKALEQYNNLKSPQQKIDVVYNRDGKPLPAYLKLRGDVTVFIKQS